MKLAARLPADTLARRFRALLGELEPRVLDAAADALAEELKRARAEQGLDAPLVRADDARRRIVGANDSASIARELGTPSEASAPWLAPSLPGARAPMRAAVLARVRDVVAAHAGKSMSAAARALSSRRKRRTRSA